MMTRYAWILLLAAGLFVGCQQTTDAQTVETTDADAPVVETADANAPADLLDGATWEYRLDDTEWQAGPLMLPANFSGEIFMRIRFDVSQDTIYDLACTQLEQLTNDRLWQMDVDYYINGTRLLPPV